MSVAADRAQHKEYIAKLRRIGGEAMQAKHEAAPGVDAGLFDYQKWEAGKAYEAGDLFTYNGLPGFVRKAHTSQPHWLPYSVGTESLYGARPRQSPDSTYPYVYNMRAEIGMLVRSAKDGAVYRAIQAADPLLWDPADVPAIFAKEETEE